MNRKIYNWLIGGALVLLLPMACKKDNYSGTDPYAGAREALNIKLDKTAASPAYAAPGATVVIKGNGLLKYKDSGMVLKFNDATAAILSVTESAITAKVPENASTGVISLMVKHEIFAGPNFRVLGPVTPDMQFRSVPGADKNNIVNLAFVPGGKFLIGGDFTDYDNSGLRYGYHGLARINADGSLDRDFKVGKGVDGMVIAMAVQASGKSVIGGSINNYDARFKSGYINNIVRLNTNGSYDSTTIVTKLGTHDTIPALNAYFDNIVAHILQTPDDGKLLVVGSFNWFMRKDFTGISRDLKRDSVVVDSIRMEGLVRLNEDGTFDSTFNYNAAERRSYEGTNGIVLNAIMQADGKIVLSGAFTRYRGELTGPVVRLNPDGSIDKTFNTGAGPDDKVYVTEPLKDGRYLIAGNFAAVNGKEARKVAVLNNDGSLYTGFSIGSGVNAGPNGLVTAAVQLKNGKIALSGSFDAFSGVKRGGFVILDEDGKVSPTYNTMGAFNGRVTKMMNLPNTNGTIVIGSFTKFDLLDLNRIMLLRY